MEECFPDFAGIWVAVREEPVRTFAFRAHDGAGKLNQFHFSRKLITLVSFIGGDAKRNQISGFGIAVSIDDSFIFITLRSFIRAFDDNCSDIARIGRKRRLAESPRHKDQALFTYASNASFVDSFKDNLRAFWSFAHVVRDQGISFLIPVDGELNNFPNLWVFEILQLREMEKHILHAFFTFDETEPVLDYGNFTQFPRRLLLLLLLLF